MATLNTDNKDYITYQYEQLNFGLLGGLRYAKRKEVSDEDAFFISQRGCRMTDFYKRLDYLKEKAAIDKRFCLHSLRHSIATHLLQSGMAIEEIARFLGHSTLDSTQIYTHLTNDLNSKPDG